MNYKKKFIIALLLIILPFLVVGCGDDSDSSLPEYKLQVESIGEGEGSVIIEPKKDLYKEGTEITLTIDDPENDGWVFDHWEGDINSTESSVSFKITSDMNIIAVFKEENPLGEEVNVENKRLYFEGGTEIDLGENQLTEGAKITVNSVNNPSLPTESELNVAGEVLDFQFEGLEITKDIEVTLPLNDENNLDKKGIFYKNSSGNWLYQESEVEEDKVKAKVNHFSTYGVLEAKVVEAPEANLASGEVNKGTPIKLSSNTANAKIYYTTDGTKPDKTSNLFKDEIIIDKETEIKAVAIKENMKNSEIVNYHYKIDSENNKASLNIGVNFDNFTGIYGEIAIESNGETISSKTIDLSTESSVIFSSIEVGTTITIKSNFYDEQDNLIASSSKEILLEESKIYDVILEVSIPTKPKNLNAEIKNDNVVLNWDEQSDAVGYLVYRSYAKDGQKKPLFTKIISENTYIDESNLVENTDYWYWVIAYNEQGIASSLSEAVNIIYENN